jgi:hypothetical protein
MPDIRSSCKTIRIETFEPRFDSKLKLQLQSDVPFCDGRSRLRWEGVIKMDIKEIEVEGVG